MMTRTPRASLAHISVMSAMSCPKALPDKASHLMIATILAGGKEWAIGSSIIGELDFLLTAYELEKI